MTMTTTGRKPAAERVAVRCVDADVHPVPRRGELLPYIPEANATASGLPGASKCRWPMTSSIVFGRRRSASGAAGLAVAKRSVIDIARVDPFDRRRIESAIIRNSGFRMKLAHAPIALAVLSALALVAAGYGARYGVWDFRLGFQLVRWSFYAGLATAVLALVALVVRRVRAGHAVELVVALLLGVVVAYFPWHWMQEARALPSINDITTDTANPPAFVAIVPLRASSAVPTTYPGAETAARQHSAYPDIKTLELAVPPDAAFARALGTAISFRWEIVARDPDSGRIEATATTPWFGFRDDVVIRVMPAPGGSRIDVRSLSRVGKGDLGANAKRVRAYLAQLSG